MTLELDTDALDTLIRRNNLKRAWQLAPAQKLTDEQYEQLREACFTEWGESWRRAIYL